MKILIKNGRIIDPATKLDGMYDLLINNRKIEKVETGIEDKADKIIDASGCYVMPGLIDLHVHLREPGLEHKETIETGMKAAARGGFTTICPMPNTKPVIDNADRVRFVTNKAKQLGEVNVLQIGAVTKGQMGAELADIEEMVDAGACAISEDGKSVMDAGLYKEAMKIAKKKNIPVFAHCEDQNMVGGGVINAGVKSEELDLPGISNAVEDVIVARDILLAKETGVQLHICHCSTKDSVSLVRFAKEAGLPVTAEVCPHHFAMTVDDIREKDANYKMNPPLRTKEDVEALKEGLRDGIMDVIATDHAPHSKEEKMLPMEKAPFGIVGLETAVALTMTVLVDKGYLTPMQMAEKMSYNPAKILGIDRGSLEPGKIADIVIIDPNEVYQIDVEKFASKGKNTPFNGWTVKGSVTATIANGKIIYMQEEEHDK
ncbi:dihydroorotase [Anaerobium acetethylicum]|uniref:Dihydroorotase n=1 Tax=Anaerobium acetethylicum TaxID=1619234 RepID=A0A1D3TQW3_9FIRM|nr:dihydroorotase [Anaerobium acetethylicum]SCP96031.1 dihydroorotase [Anaerobium acetethylicum]